MEKEKAFKTAIIAVALASIMYSGILNQTAYVSSDALANKKFAEDLLSGRLYHTNPALSLIHADALKNETYLTEYSSNLVRDDRVYAKTSIGFQLALAAYMKLFGAERLHYINTLLTMLLALSTYLLTKKIFTEDDVGYTALYSILLLSTTSIWLTYSANSITRDVLPILLLTTGLLIMTENAKLAGFLTGYAATVHVTYGLMALFYAHYIYRKNTFRGAIIFGVFFLVGFTPLLIQNNLATGTLLGETDLFELILLKNKLLSDVDEPMTNLLDIKKETPWGTLAHAYHPITLVLAFVGLAYSIKKDEVKYVMLPAMIAYVTVFSFIGRIPEVYRYNLVVHPFIILFAAYGLAKTLSKLRLDELKPDKMFPPAGLALILATLAYNRSLNFGVVDWTLLLTGASLIAYKIIPKPRIHSLAALMLSVVALTYPLYFHNIQPAHFTGKEAGKLAKGILEETQDKSVIIVCKNLGPIVEYYTERTTIPPMTLNKEIYLMKPIKEEYYRIDAQTQKEKTKRLLDSGYRVYLIDSQRTVNAIGDITNCTKVKQVLEEDYTFTAKKTMDMQEYNLEKECGKRYCTLYEIAGSSA